MGKIEGKTFATTVIFEFVNKINKIVKFHIYGVLFLNS